LKEGKQRESPPFADAYGGLPRGRKHDEDEINVAENGQLLGLLEDPGPPLRVGDLPPTLVLQLLDLELDPPHGGSRTGLALLLKSRVRQELYFANAVLFFSVTKGSDSRRRGESLNTARRRESESRRARRRLIVSSSSWRGNGIEPEPLRGGQWREREVEPRTGETGNVLGWIGLGRERRG
jgi:hypothetical protein